VVTDDSEPDAGAEPARAEWTMRYDVVRVSDLPIPNEIRGPACMLGPAPGCDGGPSAASPGFVVRYANASAAGTTR
jgi:hypothetical protein